MRYSVGLKTDTGNRRVSTIVVGSWNDGADLESFAVSGGIRFNF